MPLEEDNFEDWSRKAKGWLDSLGLHLYAFGYYRSTARLFAWEQMRSPSRRLPIKLCMGSMPDAEIRPDYWYIQAQALNGIIAPHVLLDLLDEIDLEFRTLRRQVYRRLATNGYFRSFRREIATIRRLAQESFLIDRLAVEFRDNEKFLKREAGEFSDLSNQELKDSSPRRLVDDLFETIKWRIGLIQTHMQLVNKAFSDRLGVLNMEVTYRLQRRILWLTIVVTIATVIATWIGLEDYWAQAK